MYNFQNLKFNQTKLPLYPIYDKTKKFFNFIKTLENYVQANIDTESIFCKSIEKYNTLKTIKINFNPNLKISSVLDGLKINDLQQNGEVEFIIKICHIFNNNSRYGLKLSVYQLRYIPPIEQLDIDFYANLPKINSVKKEDENVKTLLDNNMKLAPPLLPNLNKIIPSVKDLQSMISKLKKTNKDD